MLFNEAQLSTGRSKVSDYTCRIVATRFGPAIVLAIRDTPDRILKVLMPVMFDSAFSDADLEEINSGKVALNLVYKGQCVNTHAFKVTVESQ